MKSFQMESITVHVYETKCYIARKNQCCSSPVASISMRTLKVALPGKGTVTLTGHLYRMERVLQPIWIELYILNIFRDIRSHGRVHSRYHQWWGRFSDTYSLLAWGCREAGCRGQALTHCKLDQPQSIYPTWLHWEGEFQDGTNCGATPYCLSRVTNKQANQRAGSAHRDRQWPWTSENIQTRMIPRS